MKPPTASPTLRRSVVLAATLVEEARQAAPESLRGNFNRLVQKALEEYIRAQRNRAFEESMALMARDPAIAYECREASEGLAHAEGDGLGDGS